MRLPGIKPLLMGCGPHFISNFQMSFHGTTKSSIEKVILLINVNIPLYFLLFEGEHGDMVAYKTKNYSLGSVRRIVANLNPQPHLVRFLHWPRVIYQKILLIMG